MTLLEGRYRLINQLGKGGFGAVWLAQDERLDRLCAIKESYAHHPDVARTMEREAGILAHLSHPALPKVRDHFLLNNQAYLVMDYIDGTDLATLLTEAPQGLPVQRVIEWGLALCDALMYLHHLPRPVLHRDIKPANVKLTPDGRIMLVDFGIARQTTEHSLVAGQHAVTPGYSPLEQYQGQTGLQSDVYALAATLYALLTGQSPAAAPSRVAGAVLPAPSHLRPELPNALDRALMQALALYPNDRTASIDDLAHQLASCLPQITEAPTLIAAPLAPSWSAPSPLPIAPPQTAPPRRRFPTWGLVLLAGLLVGGGMVAALVLNRQPTTPPIATATTGAVITDAGSATPITPVLEQSPPTITFEPAATLPPVGTTLIPEGVTGVLYYSVRKDGGSYQIYRQPLDGSAPQPLTSAGENYTPQLSPDGSRIAFTSERDGREQVYVMNSDGSNQQRISTDTGVSQFPAWSPDGTALVYSHNDDPTATDRSSNWWIVVQPLESGVPRTISSQWGTWARWGPSGITFTTRELQRDGTQIDLVIIQPDGSGLTLLNPTHDRDENYAQWSPDGTTIAYIAGDSRSVSRRQIWLMNADGSGARQLTNGAGDITTPAWSPDGRWIAFLATWGGSAERNIWLVDVRSGEATPIIISDERKFGLAWGEK